MPLFAYVNEEAIGEVKSLNSDLWFKLSKGLASPVGDVVIAVGRLLKDNNLIHQGEKLKTIDHDLVNDGLNLFKIQKLVDSYLGQQTSNTPSPIPQP